MNDEMSMTPVTVNGLPGQVTLAAEGITLDYTVTSDSQSRSILKWRRQRRTVTALRGASLIAREGEFIGFVGLNGSGKSSLLRVLAGLEPATSGAVYARSQPQLLGVSAALIPNLSGLENIRLGCLAMGMDSAEAKSASEFIQELAGLEDSIRNPMRTYSSGMSARLRFAISVAATPDILMIDEALATGDASFAKRAEKAMNGLLTKSGTVFLVSHAAKTIEEMCTRAVWLHKGQVVADGEAAEVANGYRYFASKLAQGEVRTAEKRLRETREKHPPKFESDGAAA